MRYAKSQRNERGIALVLTLAILVIATILVVGFTSSMRTERQASASMANNATAEAVAQAAVDHAIAILEQNIPQPVPPGGSTANPTNWIISPGLLTTVKGTGTTLQIPLSSNPSATYASSPQDAELNVPQVSGTGYAIAPTSASMRVAWITVLKDPSASASSTNPINARYAFWVDDENAKLNINTAAGKPATLDFTKLTPGIITVAGSTYPLGHPSSANLDVLGSVETAQLAAAVQQQDGLKSIDAIKPYLPNGTGDTFLTTNKFNLTAYSRAPEFNVFGKSKLYFLRAVGSSTGAGKQLGFPLSQFFRDIDGPNYFPADENATGADRFSTYYTAAAISAYLNRNDWPGMPARSFVDKWTTGYTGAAAKREADQVAWNMVALGTFAAGDFSGDSASTHYDELANRAKSTELGFISVNKPNSDAVMGSLSHKAILPLSPAPKINEVELVILPESYTDKSTGQQKYRLNVSLSNELWVPAKFPAYDAATAPLSVGLTYLFYKVTQDNNPNVSTQEDSKYLTSATPNGIKVLYSKLSGTSGNPLAQDSYDSLTTLNPFYVRTNQQGFNNSAVGAADFLTSGIIHCDFKMRVYLRGPNATAQLIPVWDTHDPRTTAAATGWNANPSIPNPTSPLQTLDDTNDYIELKFDLDPTSFGTGPITRSLEVADCRLGGTSKGWVKAPSFDTPTAPSADTLGRKNAATIAAHYDVDKIGFADLAQTSLTSKRSSTGFLCFIPTGMQRGIAGSGLKFQPSTSANELPDWLLLDLVAPNVIATDYPMMSYMNSTAGKLNVNASLTAKGSFAPPQRWQPLQGLFENMPNVSGTSAASPVVTNILNHTLSGQEFGATGVYDYPGEICEVKGVADSGAQDWDKEAIIRNLASTITTQSNVFSIWGVAQTIKKNPANNSPGAFQTKSVGAAADDVITGERRFEAVVERYVWPGNDAAPGNANVGSGATYANLSTGAAKPGLPPPYSGGSWEAVDGPNAPTYPVTNSDPWTTNGANYTSSTLDTANNPAGASMKYRIIYFKYLDD